MIGLPRVEEHGDVVVVVGGEPDLAEARRRAREHADLYTERLGDGVWLEGPEVLVPPVNHLIGGRMVGWYGVWLPAQCEAVT